MNTAHVSAPASGGFHNGCEELLDFAALTWNFTIFHHFPQDVHNFCIWDSWMFNDVQKNHWHSGIDICQESIKKISGHQVPSCFESNVAFCQQLSAPWWSREAEPMRATRHGSNWSSESEISVITTPNFFSLISRPGFFLHFWRLLRYCLHTPVRWLVEDVEGNSCSWREHSPSGSQWPSWPVKSHGNSHGNSLKSSHRRPLMWDPSVSCTVTSGFTASSWWSWSPATYF